MRDVKPIIGYVHTGIEKSCEDQQYWKVIPFVERMDYLVLLLQRDGFLPGGGEPARRGGAAARPVAAGDSPRAEPDRLAPVLDRHRLARHRRDHDALVGLPRPRPRARPVRDVGRPALPHALLPGGRRGRGHPARLRGDDAQVHQDDAHAHPAVPRPARPQRDLASAHEGNRDRARGGPAGARRDRPAAARRRPPVGPAQGDAVLRLRALRLQRAGRDGGRQLRPLPRARRGDVRVAKIVEQALDGLPEGPYITRTARSRCRRATSWRPRWRR